VEAGEENFDDWCVEAAERFLQSVLVVDDRATLEGPAAVTQLDTPPEHPVSDAEVESNDEPTAIPELELDAKLLTDEFAARGLVCGVMRPDPGEPTPDMVVPTASRADIVLLDWRLRDKGERALDIIHELAEQDGLRLIGVYTSAGDLDQIASDICTRLNGGDDQAQEPYAHDEGSFRVIGAGLTIEVYAKEGSDVLPEEKGRSVTTQDLPGRLIDDFAQMTRGIVPSTAVATIGELRAATPRVLRLLGSGLDAGYLGHRILLSDPDESGDHLLGLIGSEFMAAVENSELIKRAVSHRVVNQYVDQMPVADEELDKELLKEVLRLGTASKAAKEKLKDIPEVMANEPKLVRSKPTSQTLRFTARNEVQAADADRRFAMKLSLETLSGAEARLRLGTVVKDQNDIFLICLQPECDSVRIDAPRDFPFLPMTRPEDSAQREDLLVDDSGPVGLRITRDPFALRMLRFAPDPGSRAIAAVEDEGRLYFESVNDGRLSFVTQLRSGHAQDLAHQLAHQLSRIALNQSEVQRIWQKGT
jgi:hypothetical protein